MRGLSLSFILSLFIADLAAQPAAELKKYQEKYPAESAVFLQKKEHVYISVEDGELQITTEFYEERMFLDNKAALFTERSIEYSGFYDLFDIKGHTLLPQKKKYKPYSIGEISEKDEFSAGVFYDDVKSKNFLFPALREGAKTVLSYKQKTKEPRFLSGFYLADVIPIDHQEMIIETDHNVELDFGYFNTTPEAFHYSQSTEGNKIIHKWVGENTPKLILESSAPSHLHYIPHIIPRIKMYKNNGSKVNVLSDAKDLHNWYYDLIQRVDRSKSTELIAITDSLVSGMDNDFDKVKAVYDWVQNNIKYIAVEDGLGGFIPRSPTTVCENRYGDCKDMTSIMVQMLDIAGVDAYITWVGTRDIPYTYTEVPTPSVDNHMIATYIDENGKHYFLDATGQYSPIHLPSSFIQGKEVMINHGERFKLMEVPTAAASDNLIADSVQIRILNDTLKGSGKSYFTGYQKVEMTENLTRVEPGQEKKFFKAYFNKGSNKFLIEAAEVTNLSDKYKPLEVTYSFNIADYVTRHEDEIFVNLNLERLFQNSSIEKDRKLGVERDYMTQIEHRVELELPEGFDVNYLPENSQLENEAFRYQIRYGKEEGKVFLTLSIQFDYLVLEPSMFDTWNDMILSLNAAYNEQIILKKKG